MIIARLLKTTGGAMQMDDYNTLQEWVITQLNIVACEALSEAENL
jgi:hypothetical protein